MIAAEKGHLEIVSLLIERGANMDLQNKVKTISPPSLMRRVSSSANLSCPTM
jgi:hypothetical protein